MLPLRNNQEPVVLNLLHQYISNSHYLASRKPDQFQFHSPPQNNTNLLAPYDQQLTSHIRNPTHQQSSDRDWHCSDQLSLYMLNEFISNKRKWPKGVQRQLNKKQYGMTSNTG